ncbi:YchJ family metal-binding protein [Vibrio casei]|uniref:YchJ family metal-binding protein n=1 Tax=Vibrio casei TaxID=673372 RepID=UPI003F995741
MPCSCGHPQAYENCCQPIHQNAQLAKHPEQLMRARYSAHVLNDVEFVLKTYHSSCKAYEQAESIEESVRSHWIELKVIDSQEQDDEGYVEFKAYFEDNGQSYCLHERSRFLKEDNEWRYIDGVIPEEKIVDPRLLKTIADTKIGRNEPCLCGSGKKFKKCCG